MAGSWKDKLAKTLENRRYLIIITICLVILVPFLVMAIFNQPIADDYVFFSQKHPGNPFITMADSYLHWTGRLSPNFLVSIFYHFWGSKTPAIMAMFLLVSLVIVSVWFIKVFFKQVKARALPRSQVLALGLLMTSLIMLSAYSIYDSYLWLTSSTIYITSIICAIAVVTLTIQLFTKPIITWFNWLIYVVSLIFTAFCCEITTIYLVGSFGFLLIIYGLVKRFKLFKLKKTTKHNIRVLVIGMIITAGCLLIIYFSPGSIKRRRMAHSLFDWYKVFIEPLFQMAKLGYLVTWERVLLVIGSGSALATVLPKLRPRQAISVVASIVLYLLAISYVFYLIMGYSLGGNIPLRAYIVPAGIILIGVTVILAVLLRKCSANITYLLDITMILALIGVVATSYRVYKPIIRAVVLRHDAYITREINLQQQANRTGSAIRVMPLPVLLQNSEAQDIAFNNIQAKWVTEAFKQYYHLANDVMLVSLPQDEHYCTVSQKDTPYYYGAQTCDVVMMGR